jgi:hypothetical protein
MNLLRTPRYFADCLLMIFKRKIRDRVKLRLQEAIQRKGIKKMKGVKRSPSSSKSVKQLHPMHSIMLKGKLKISRKRDKTLPHNMNSNQKQQNCIITSTNHQMKEFRANLLSQQDFFKRMISIALPRDLSLL